MIKVLLLVLIPFQVLACDKYLKIGAGYKFSEASSLMTVSQPVEIFGGKYMTEPEEVSLDFGSKISARAEFGCKLATSEKTSMIYGLSHHSQYLSGAPLNNDLEYYKTELFIDFQIDF